MGGDVRAPCGSGSGGEGSGGEGGCGEGGGGECGGGEAAAVSVAVARVARARVSGKVAVAMLSRENAFSVQEHIKGRRGRTACMANVFSSEMRTESGTAGLSVISSVISATVSVLSPSLNATSSVRPVGLLARWFSFACAPATSPVHHAASSRRLSEVPATIFWC